MKGHVIFNYIATISEHANMSEENTTTAPSESVISNRCREIIIKSINTYKNPRKTKKHTNKTKVV